MKTAKFNSLKLLPILLAAAAAVVFLVHTFTPDRDETFAYTQFATLPVISNGRVQPMESLARNSLLQIRGKSEANLEPWKSGMQNPKMIPAVQWLAAVMMDSATADQWPEFRVDNPEVISLLKLPGKDLTAKHDGEHYAWNEIEPGWDSLVKESERIEKIDASQRNAYEKAAIKIRDQMWLYAQLRNTVQPAIADNWAQELVDYENLIPAGVEAVQAERAGQKYDQDVLRKFGAYVEQFKSMAQIQPPMVVPPAEANAANEGWRRMGDALVDELRDGQADPTVHAYAAMATAFQAGNVAEFNQQLASYRSSLVPVLAPQLKKVRWEVFFNHMQPFYSAMMLYVLAGVMVCLFWINLSETLRRTAVWLVVVALLIHSTGLIFRMVLEGRPPVTNLYSSAIFIGWGACILGLILEAFWKSSIGVVVSAGIGFITLIIAHYLALTGDTMEMMRAVLDTNIWLATHVVIVTLGYASTFVAGFLAIVYIVLGFFTPNLTRGVRKGVSNYEEAVLTKRERAIAQSEKGIPEVHALVGTLAGHQVAGAVLLAMEGKRASDRVSAREANTKLNTSLAKMVYGIVCFATLFSFVGTVLGGIWADQSWGRFWGWDPKENGALIIVLWNAMILHLRWGGIIRERGLINCAIVGNIVTSWSWFGVNMLGIGLHSYGFMEAAFWWLIAFVLSQLCLIAIGCLPLRMWKSFRDQVPPPLPPDNNGTQAGAPAPA